VRLVHVITGLHVGGAETMLWRLLPALRSSGFAQEVVSLLDPGPVAARIEALGLRCHALGMRRGVPSAAKALRLARLLRRERPDVVQTWMYHADLLGGAAARLAGAPVVWGIHHSTLDARTTRWTTRATVRSCAWLSGAIPARIVCVSRSARALHVAAGYCERKFVVIPNGFDLARFAPDPPARREVRRELGVADGAVLVGLVARVHPQKDHPNLLRAAAILARTRPEVRYVLCGDGTADDRALLAAIREAGVADRFLLLGRRDDVPRLMGALDVATLPSAFGEAFPLAIGEAMACGVPCAVTDVGDSAELVGDTGRVVPPRDPAALARALGELAEMGPEGRRALGEAARARIEANYSLAQVAARYAEVYRSVAAPSAEPLGGVAAG
jgi:glycosyltransferase involved in cell wall biosynthesis